MQGEEAVNKRRGQEGFAQCDEENNTPPDRLEPLGGSGRLSRGWVAVDERERREKARHSQRQSDDSEYPKASMPTWAGLAPFMILIAVGGHATSLA